MQTLILELIPLRVLVRWLRRLYARWPRRTARRILPVLIMDVLPRGSSANLGLNHTLRQAGYTNGDRVVILLESDYQRVCHVAQEKLTNPLWQMAAYMVEHSALERLQPANNGSRVAG